MSGNLPDGCTQDDCDRAAGGYDPREDEEDADPFWAQLDATYDELKDDPDAHEFWLSRCDFVGKGQP